MTCFWWFLHNFTWSCFTSSPPLYPSQPFSLTLRPRRVRNLRGMEMEKKNIRSTRLFAHMQASFAIATKRGKFIVNWGIAVLMLGCKGGFTSLFNPLSGESFFLTKWKNQEEQRRAFLDSRTPKIAITCRTPRSPPCLKGAHRPSCPCLRDQRWPQTWSLAPPPGAQGSGGHAGSRGGRPNAWQQHEKTKYFCGEHRGQGEAKLFFYLVLADATLVYIMVGCHIAENFPSVVVCHKGENQCSHIGEKKSSRCHNGEKLNRCHIGESICVTWTLEKYHPSYGLLSHRRKIFGWLE